MRCSANSTSAGFMCDSRMKSAHAAISSSTSTMHATISALPTKPSAVDDPMMEEDEEEASEAVESAAFAEQSADEKPASQKQRGAPRSESKAHRPCAEHRARFEPIGHSGGFESKKKKTRHKWREIITNTCGEKLKNQQGPHDATRANTPRGHANTVATSSE